MKLVAILLTFALLLGGCATATAPADTEPHVTLSPPMWLVVAMGLIALLVGFGLARVTPAIR